MGIDSIYKDAFITCVRDSSAPYGRMCNICHTEEEAQNHIKFQKKQMGSNAHWDILHIKDIEWIPYKE